MENLTGHSLKGYELLERIGSGGFGAVYRAYQTTIGREVAVKVILPHFADRPDFIRRFEAEAQLVARLEHLHIVPLYDYWRQPGGAYLVMRWLRGGSAADALSGGPLSLESSALLLDQIGAALTVAHTAGVVHRDLKPSNILLDEEGNAYLADFGIAMDLRRDDGSGQDGETILGSPAYLAPEQVRGEAVMPQTDIYSLGVTLYELLAAAHPFSGGSKVEVLYKQLDEPLPRLATVAEEVQADVNGVIQKATAKDPRARYEDALSLAVAFRKAAQLKEREAQELVELLTQREQEVLRLIVDGLTNRQIAQELFVEHSTVRWHIRQIYGKLDVRNRRQAIARAREMQLGAAEPAKPGAESTSVILPLPPLANPYKGLRPFTAADRADFFGREALLSRLLECLQLAPAAGAHAAPGTGRFLTIVGPSGSGKSSLVRAGLVPALWEGKLPGSEGWFVVEMTPGARPLDELEVALMRVAADQKENLREQLCRDASGLLRAAQLILPRDASELMLVIDQFEELFSLVEDETERAHFLDLLTTAVSDPRSRVRVVLTLRADYYDRPLHYRDFGQLVRRHMETVLPLKAQELERAIVKPAAALEVTFEPGLVAAIVDDVLYQPGALPLLQYALTELFEQRDGRTLTHEAYTAIGGATGALAQRAEELYEEQDAGGRELIRQLFLRLVSVGRDDDAAPATRRRVHLRELLALDADEDLLDEVLDIFVAYRLLTLDHDPGSRRPTVEVAHEALLREWERLREWLAESRADLRLRRQLARAVAEWRQAEEDASFLLRGRRLEQFESWSEETQLKLTGEERAYLEASALRRDEREAAEAARRAREATLERRARRVLVALAVVFLLAAMLSGWLALNATRNFARSESQRLAAEAVNVLERGGSHELAALLALHGLATHYTPQADLALQRAAGAYADSMLVELPADAFEPLLSPDNRYLHFYRLDDQGGSAPVTEFWDVQAMERLWQTADYILPGPPHMTRNVTADSSAVVALTLPDEELVLLDVQSGAHALTFEGQQPPSVTYLLSADGTLLIGSMANGDVPVWNAQSGELLQRFHVGGGGYARRAGRALVVAISPDNRLAVARAPSQTHVWDIDSGERLYLLEHGFAGGSSGLQFVDGSRLLAVAVEPALSLWDLTTGREVEHDIPPSGIDVMSPDARAAGALSPDGRYFVQGGLGEASADFILWEVATSKALARLTGHTATGRAVGFTGDGRFLVTSGGNDGTVRVWDVPSGRERLVLAGHTADIDAFLSPDDHYIVTASKDATVRIWELQALLRGDFQLDGARHTLYLSPDGLVALTTEPEENNTVLVKTDSFEVVHKLDFTLDLSTDGLVPAGPIFSGDGQMVLGVKDSTRLAVHDVASGDLIGEHANPDGVYKYAAFVPGSRRIFAGGDRGAYLLDAMTGEQVRVFEPPDFVIEQPLSGFVAVSPDGRYGALYSVTTFSLGFMKSVYLWDLETGAVKFRSTPRSDDRLRAFAFSDDSRYFAWGGSNRTVYLRDLDSDEQVLSLIHPSTVLGIAFSSDSGLLLSSSLGDYVTAWDLESGEAVRQFFAGSGPNGFVDFVDNDTFVLFGTREGGEIHRQPLAVDGLIESMCDRVQRDLTAEQRQLYDLGDSPACPQFGIQDKTGASYLAPVSASQ